MNWSHAVARAGMRCLVSAALAFNLGKCKYGSRPFTNIDLGMSWERKKKPRPAVILSEHEAACEMQRRRGCQHAHDKFLAYPCRAASVMHLEDMLRLQVVDSLLGGRPAQKRKQRCAVGCCVGCRPERRGERRKECCLVSRSGH